MTAHGGGLSTAASVSTARGGDFGAVFGAQIIISKLCNGLNKRF